MIIKADIRFCDGAVRRCIGKVVNRQSVPFESDEDVIKHVNAIAEKRAGYELVRIIHEEI